MTQHTLGTRLMVGTASPYARHCRLIPDAGRVADKVALDPLQVVEGSKVEPVLCLP